MSELSRIGLNMCWSWNSVVVCDYVMPPGHVPLNATCKILSDHHQQDLPVTTDSLMWHDHGWLSEGHRHQQESGKICLTVRQPWWLSAGHESSRSLFFLCPKRVEMKQAQEAPPLWGLQVCGRISGCFLLALCSAYPQTKSRSHNEMFDWHKTSLGNALFLTAYAIETGFKSQLL